MVQKCKGTTLKGFSCKRCVTHKSGYCFSHHHQSKIKTSDLEEKKCGICLDKANVQDALECGHLYHRRCIRKTNKIECPTCRIKLKTLPSRINMKIMENAMKIDESDDEFYDADDYLMSLVYNVIYATRNASVIDSAAYYDESTGLIRIFISS